MFRNPRILGKKLRQIKRESGAGGPSFGYSAGVFSKSSLSGDMKMCAWPVKAGLFLALPVLCACAGPRIAPPEPPQVFYTVTGEIALSRGEARTAALQYTAAAQSGTDSKLMARASEVTSECLQPSLTAAVAARWLDVEPHSLDAHRAAARAALELARIEESASAIPNRPRELSPRDGCGARGARVAARCERQRVRRAAARGPVGRVLPRLSRGAAHARLRGPARRRSGRCCGRFLPCPGAHPIADERRGQALDRGPPRAQARAVAGTDPRGRRAGAARRSAGACAERPEFCERPRLCAAAARGTAERGGRYAARGARRRCGLPTRGAPAPGID